MDYSALPVETRMMALGLAICLPRRVGRARALSMLQRIEVAIAWGEHLNAAARRVAPRERTQVRRLQQKIAAAHMNGVAPFLLERMSARLDRLGRMTSEIILSPRIALPKADKAIAKQFGITERMVRKVRSDPRMQPFMPQPIWKVPDWQGRGAELHAARSAAKRLMTPERYAKNERVALVSAGLVVEQAASEVYEAAWRVFTLVRRFERLMPLEYRSRPAWLGFTPQWLRIEARCGKWFFRNDQQIYQWESHPNGSRISRK
jgi:hypothetical protein